MSKRYLSTFCFLSCSVFLNSSCHKIYLLRDVGFSSSARLNLFYMTEATKYLEQKLKELPGQDSWLSSEYL